MLKFLFFSLLLLVFVAPLRRFLFWLVVGRQIVKEQRRYSDTTTPQQPKEGEVKVDYAPSNKQKKTNKGGQYIDYEEIKE